jgi:hypothetical protein
LRVAEQVQHVKRCHGPPRFAPGPVQDLFCAREYLVTLGRQRTHCQHTHGGVGVETHAAKKMPGVMIWQAQQLSQGAHAHPRQPRTAGCLEHRAAATRNLQPLDRLQAKQGDQQIVRANTPTQQGQQCGLVVRSLETQGEDPAPHLIVHRWRVLLQRVDVPREEFLDGTPQIAQIGSADTIGKGQFRQGKRPLRNELIAHESGKPLPGRTAHLRNPVADTHQQNRDGLRVCPAYQFDDGRFPLIAVAGASPPRQCARIEGLHLQRRQCFGSCFPPLHRSVLFQRLHCAASVCQGDERRPGFYPFTQTTCLSV